MHSIKPDEETDLKFYDYRYIGEEEGDIYQLVIDQTSSELSNEDLFNRLYHFINVELQLLMAENFRLSPYNCLEHHYMSCKLPRFAFVNFTKEQYFIRKAQTEDTISENDETRSNFLRWFEDHEKNSAIYEGTIRIQKKASNEDAERMEIPAGTLYTFVPEPKNNEEAFQRLKFLTGPQVSEYLIKEFNAKYSQPNTDIYSAELLELNKFTDEINMHSLKEAFQKTDNNYQHEYLRITNGYYQNHRCEYIVGGTPSQVYGKYILFKEWLKNRFRESIEPRPNETLSALELGSVSDQFGLSPDVQQLIFKRTRLRDFFQVPDNSFRGRFWYDINDIATDDPGKVVRVSEISIRQTKMATKDDFSIVLTRANIIPDTNSRAFKFFAEDLTAHLKTMIANHRELHKPEERNRQHYELLALAEEFILWLDNICGMPNAELVNLPAEELISLGEGDFIEFKSTLRIDMETGAINKDLEHSVLKTLAAFLNGIGGILLIGVADDRKIIGLERDFNSFKGHDKIDEFKKYFDDKFSNQIGNVHFRNLKIEFPQIDGSQICLIRVVQPSSEPVVLTADKTSQQFYIRRQASSVTLKPAEIARYVKNHWKN